MSRRKNDRAAVERSVKTLVFNSDGHLTLDEATWQVLHTLPRKGIYDLLFGKEDADGCESE